MSDLNLVSRRDFLRLTGIVSTGLIFGVNFIESKAVTASNFSPHLFLSFSEKGPIKIVCHRSEMGQGTRTAIVSLIAEELDVDLDQIQIVQAQGDQKFGDQNTDGSKSIRANWTRLRQVGANVRSIFVKAAALHFECLPSELKTSNGTIIYKNSRIEYAQLLDRASKISSSTNAELKNPSEFKILGKKQLLLDVPDMISGKSIYGMDVRLEGMVYAALKRSPNPFGSLKSFDSKEVRKIPGVLDVFSFEAVAYSINSNAAVCVVGESTHVCFEALKRVKIEWEDAQFHSTDSKGFRAQLDSALEAADQVVSSKGSVSKFKTKDFISKKYFTPFLAHSPMEPLVATARVSSKGCEVWAPVQDPQRIRKAVASFLNIEEEKVTINVTFLGGGFGRKSQPDFVLEAVQAAKKVQRPVKLVWQREDEVKHGFYHAACAQQLTASLIDTKIQTWVHRSVFPTIMTVFNPASTTPASWELGMGATNNLYSVPNKQVLTGVVKSPVRIGWLRAVCNVFHAFAINCFVDEIAQSLRQDPIEYHLSLLKSGDEVGGYSVDRMKTVIKKVRDFSEWNERVSTQKLGFACHHSFGSYVAAVVEAEGTKLEDLKIKKIQLTIDLGQYVNPDTVKAQMEGAAVFAMSAVYYGKIDLHEGAVVQNNFHDYQMVRAHEMPQIEVEIIDNAHPPAGCGEPGVPAVVPALVNAVSRVINKRIYELPLMG